MDQVPPPIDILPDDVLLYLLDGFVDDHALGACLLAWRRFHVLCRRRLLGRKYRWATLSALCAAGDDEGLDYALARPDLFVVPQDPLFWNQQTTPAAAGGHAHMVRRLAHMAGIGWPLDADNWTRVLVQLGRSGRAGCLEWMCREHNRPTLWDDELLIISLLDAATRGYRPDDAARVVAAVQTFAGFAVSAHDATVWTRLYGAARGRDRECIRHAVEGILSRRDISTIGGAIIMCFERGHFALLKDLVGDERLAAALADMVLGRCGLPMVPMVPRDDADGSLWIYERVPDVTQCSRDASALRLVDVASRAGRADILDRVMPDVASLSPKRVASTLTRACAVAASLAHVQCVERILLHAIDPTILDVVFDGCAVETGPRCDGARSPLVMHRNRDDLYRALLDRRPREGVAQANIDARVDHMITITAEDALDQGAMQMVRRLCRGCDRDRAVVESVVARRRNDISTGRAPKT